jgi:hypothetical protein
MWAVRKWAHTINFRHTGAYCAIFFVPVGDTWKIRKMFLEWSMFCCIPPVESLSPTATRATNSTLIYSTPKTWPRPPTESDFSGLLLVRAITQS